MVSVNWSHTNTSVTSIPGVKRPTWKVNVFVWGTTLMPILQAGGSGTLPMSPRCFTTPMTYDTQVGRVRVRVTV